MTKTPHLKRIFIPGASGRLGKLLQGAAASAPRPCEQVKFATRSGADGLARIDADHIPQGLPSADVVVGLWGVTSGTEAELERNVALAAATRDLAKAAEAKLVLHLSSAGVYGPGENLSEQDAATPSTPYGMAKLRMEQAVASFSDNGLHHCVLRLANVVGADSLSCALKADAATPVTLTEFEDSRGPLRSYIAPGQLLDIIRSLAALPPETLPSILNIAASAPVEMEALARAAGKDVAWKPVTPDDRQTVTLSTRQLASLLPGAALHRTAEDMITDWQEAEAQL